MNIETIWETYDWTTHARTLINGIGEFPLDSKLILILRHSHRNEPEILNKVHKLRLTPEGHAIAKKFGESLPNNRPIRIFHSIIWRCEETAENIHNGFKGIGGTSELKGKFSPLYDIGIEDRSFLEQLKNYHFKEILFRWVTGFYLPKEWTPFIQYSQKAAYLIWNQLTSAPERGLDIYVTHDWHLMSLRFGWFGLPPDERWVSFLGGFAFTFEEDRILLLDYGELKSLEIPHWWK
ncbi:MAG: histidine phosphatase family protein [Candidatus Thorarchaeota archaeon]